MAKRRRAESLSEAEGSDISYDEPPKKKGKVSKKVKGKTAPASEELVYSESIPHGKSLHNITEPETICNDLLSWYSAVHTTRGMPWRKPYDPNLAKEARAQRAYEVWVSEIMLQQTQVATVIPYFNAWMDKFPTIRDLAEAPIDDVNAIWKGLGYYSRASRLLAGAQKCVADYDGLLPDNAKDMEKNIPGVGRYTAGAICSIAYGERAPVLDGNVHRLLSRVLALHSSPKAKNTLDILWAGAAAIVQVPPNAGKALLSESENSSLMVANRYPGDINQALIELGSTVCKVKAPNCSGCPIKAHCAAYQKENKNSSQESDIEDLCTICEPLVETGVTAYPMKVDRKKAREETDLVSVIEWASSHERYFLLVRRPEEGLLAGLFEFPGRANVTETLTAKRCAVIAHEQLLDLFEDSILPASEKSGAQSDSVGMTIKLVKPAGDVLHIFSHIRKTYRVQWVKLIGGDQPPKLKVKIQKGRKSTTVEAVWKPLADVETVNVGTGVMKIWKLVQRCWHK